MRRDPREVDARQPLPIRATSLVLGVWVAGLLILAFVIVPALFATCGPNPGVQ